MNAATAFAQPPERRRCSHKTRPDRRARATSDRPPNRTDADPNERAPSTRMRIDFSPMPSRRHHRPEPDWTLQGGQQ
jgi:hypothetical protein